MGVLWISAALYACACAQQPDTLKHTITPPTGGLQSHTQFGRSVAVQGAFTVVGAYLDDTGDQDSGVAKVFDTTTGTLLFVLENPAPGFANQFGISVAISGTKVIVGAQFNDTGANGAGSAYIYDLSSGNPTVPIHTLDNPAPASNDGFGFSVAISGNKAVVGAFFDDAGATDAGSAYVYDLASATPTVPLATLNNPNPAATDYFGDSVAISGNFVIVGALRADFTGSDSGRAYVYDLTSGNPSAPMLLIDNPTPAAGDFFGAEVAISGTYAAVSAPLDNQGATDAGRVYVYDLASVNPTTPILTLDNPDPAASDEFGIALAMSGTKIVVGAYRDDADNQSDAGTAYVYDILTGLPSPVATLPNPDASPDDQFGFSVAINDSYVVSGARFDDAGATNAGSAYVYDLAGTNPVQPLATLNDPDSPRADYFGSSIAISGNYVAVGALFDNAGASRAGRVYVFDLTAASPTLPAFVLDNPTPSTDARFGASVGVSGAYLVVGAPFDNSTAPFAGRAYVYNLAQPSPTVPALILENPAPASSDAFGHRVAIHGTRIVVGAYQDDAGATDSGSAYVYNLAGTSPAMPELVLSNPAPASGDKFGFSVGISGTRVIIGSPDDDTGAANAGSAYVYNVTSGTPSVPIAILNNPSATSDDNFGISVAISGTRVVVGAERDNTSANDAGSAYVYELSSGTPSVPSATLNNPAPAAGDRFGVSVSISGTRIVVGSHLDDAGAADAGSAYVYDLSSPSPTAPVAALNHPSSVANDRFGYSAAIDGTNAAFGAEGVDVAGNNRGSAYIFAPDDTRPPTLTYPTSSAVSDSLVRLEYDLPENGLAGSLRIHLSNGVNSYELTPAAGYEIAGAHSIAFPLDDPSRSTDIASTPAMPMGTYTVSISYQDLAGNPRAYSGNTTGVSYSTTGSALEIYDNFFKAPARDANGDCIPHPFNGRRPSVPQISTDVWDVGMSSDLRCGVLRATADYAGLANSGHLPLRLSFGRIYTMVARMKVLSSPEGDGSGFGFANPPAPPESTFTRHWGIPGWTRHLACLYVDNDGGVGAYAEGNVYSPGTIAVRPQTPTIPVDSWQTYSVVLDTSRNQWQQRYYLGDVRGGGATLLATHSQVSYWWPVSALTLGSNGRIGAFGGQTGYFDWVEVWSAPSNPYEVIVRDNFTDGSYTNTNPGDPDARPWFLPEAAPGTQLAVVNDEAGLHAGYALRVNPQGAQNSRVFCTFGKKTLSQSGDTLRVHFAFRFEQPVTTAGTQFGWGVFNTAETVLYGNATPADATFDDRGIGAVTDPNLEANGSTRITTEEAGDVALGGSLTPMPTGTGGQGVVADTVKHYGTLQIVRLANGNLRCIAGIDFGHRASEDITPTAASHYSFDGLGIGWIAGATPFRIDNVVVSFTNPAVDSLADWRDKHGLPQGGASDLAMPAGDGLPNILKYAFGLAPNAGDLLIPTAEVMPVDGTRGLPRIDILPDDSRIFSMVRRKPNEFPRIRYIAQYSPDLDTWSDLVSPFQIENIDGSWERARFLVPNGMSGFLRVLVRIQDE